MGPSVVGAQEGNHPLEVRIDPSQPDVDWVSTIYIGLGGFEGGRPVLTAEGQAHGGKFVVEALAVRCVSGGASRAVPPKDGAA
jgi:hypothetical protein